MKLFRTGLETHSYNHKPSLEAGFQSSMQTKRRRINFEKGKKIKMSPHKASTELLFKLKSFRISKENEQFSSHPVKLSSEIVWLQALNVNLLIIKQR